MLRFGLCALLLSAVALPASAQMQNNTPAAGTAGMGVGQSGWVMPPPGGNWAFGSPLYRHALPARPDQVRVGATVRSTRGPVIGRIAYADAKVAVVKSDHWALRLPIKAFGVGQKDLLIELSPTGFDKLAEAHGARVS